MTSDPSFWGLGLSRCLPKSYAVHAFADERVYRKGNEMTLNAVRLWSTLYLAPPIEMYGAITVIPIPYN
jgi:hypothetical protein